jgi:hypothetical protein
MLSFATFLAFKTRSAGKHYDHYNECKQMGISVYNILFSAIVGFTAIVNPLANYLLRHYAIAVATLWANSFSVTVLFIPKLYIFFKQKKEIQDEQKKKRKTSTQSDDTLASHLPGPHENSMTHSSFLRAHQNQEREIAFQPTHSITPFLYNEPEDLIHPTASLTSNAAEISFEGGHYENTNVYVEVQEGDVPIRKTFRYFPFLSQWKMRRLMIFPSLRYISYYSEKSKKGTMISYTHAAVYSSKPEEYVLKIHGQDKYDVYIQLGDFVTMESWQACLNQDIMKLQERESIVFRKSSNDKSKKASSTSTESTLMRQTAVLTPDQESEEEKTHAKEQVARYIPRRRRSKSDSRILLNSFVSCSAGQNNNTSFATRKRSKTFNVASKYN